MKRSQLRRNCARTLLNSLETLEPRLAQSGFRSYDGTGNNLLNNTWGSAGVNQLRLTPAEYADGKSSPAGSDRASARAVSNLVADHADGEAKSERGLSAFAYAWGQFIDHDLDLTLSASPAESFPIAVPKGDPQFDPASTGTKTIPLSRSIYDPATGTSASNPRQQTNSITAFIDGSMVYGSDAATAASLRSFSGGLMKQSANGLLPLAADGKFFSAGDIRANENPELIAMQTLFVREHNRVASELAKMNPAWNDERLFQEARRIVIGEIQVITYKEFLPAMIGEKGVAPYRGYRPDVNPGIANEFSTAAFRVGHTMVADEIGFLDNQGNEVRDEVSLADAFFNPDLVKETNIGPILKYLASDRAEEIDLQVVDSLRNMLFGPPGAGGLDLAALNIQRGRDHGLADYNDARAAYGLPRVRDFSDISKNPAVQAQLKAAYGTVDKIDLWVGGIAEDHVPGASVGPTFQRIIADQFMRTRDGDRFWYQRDLQGPALDRVERTTLADVIRRNSTTTNLQDNVFFFRTEVSGRVFADLNADGKNNPTEQGLGGRKIELLDSTGAVIASTVTNPQGFYRFTNLELGSYSVREVLPPGAKLTTKPSYQVLLTRGGAIGGLSFGEAPKPSAPPTTQTPPKGSPLAPPPPPMGVDAVFADLGGTIGPKRRT